MAFAVKKDNGAAAVGLCIMLKRYLLIHILVEIIRDATVPSPFLLLHFNQASYYTGIENHPICNVTTLSYCFIALI